jgi:MerR family transcriptional regulator, thiopeptide resistance regulator
MRRRYRVGEFAALSGVSIRTLHHYDRIGLLRPAGRSEAGYRFYEEADLLRLQQILTLRYLGFSLGQIRDLLARPDFDLVASLRIQRAALRDRIAELERIEAGLAELLERRLASGRWDWALVASAAASLHESLNRRGAKMHEYYTPEQMQQLVELRAQVPAEEIQAIEQGWTALLADVRANRGLDPSSPEAQELADRWDRLTRATIDGYRGNQELLGAIAENYRQGRFTEVESAPQPEDFAFIERVKEARQGRSAS